MARDERATVEKARKWLTANPVVGVTIRETPTPQFDWKPHFVIRVKGLAGIGVVHLDNPEQAAQINLCVFEPPPRTPASRNEKDFDEVFEREGEIASLPAMIDAWRKFRSKEVLVDKADALAPRQKWLADLARHRRALAPAAARASELFEHGDLPGAWKAAGIDMPAALFAARPRLPAGVDAGVATALAADVAQLDPGLLAWHLPADRTGRWHLKRRIPLARYQRNRVSHADLCLLLETAQRRSGRAQIKLQWLGANKQSARLDSLRPMWDRRAASDFAALLAGSTPAQLAKLAQPSRRASSTAATILAHQDAGDVEAACAAAGIEMDDALHNVRRGKRVVHMCTCCAPLDRQLTEWSGLILSALAGANLLRLNALVRHDVEFRQRYVATRKPGDELIFTFPLQRHTRKARVAVLATAAGTRLTIVTTGSDVCLPQSLWQLPPDLALLRRGLISPDDLPPRVAAQYGVG